MPADPQGQRVAIHVPVLTTNPKKSTQAKSPPMVEPRRDASKVQRVLSVKISGLKKIVTPSTEMTVPNIAISLPKQPTEPGKQTNAPETNSPEAQIVSTMSTVPVTLVAVPTQSPGAPSGQNIGVPIRQRPSLQDSTPSHSASTDGMVVVVVDERRFASVVLVAIVVVVAGAGQAAPPHASQQLGRSPMQAMPRRGALHAAGFRLTLHV